MKENINRLAALLNAVRCLPVNAENEYRISAMQYGIVAMMLKEGVGYQKHGDEFSVFVGEDEYTVPESYAGAYLGDFTIDDVKQREGIGVAINYEEQNIISEEELADVDACLAELEYHVSRMYQDVVLGSTDSIPSLKAKIAELTEANESLKKELKREKAKNAALTDRLNIISGNVGSSKKPKTPNHHTDMALDTTSTTTDKSRQEEVPPESPVDISLDNEVQGTLVSSTQSDNGTEIVEWDYDATPDEPVEPEITEEVATFGIFPYQDDIYEMSKHAFCFVYNRLVLVDEQEEDVDFVELLVIPLSTKVKYPDLLIWTAQNEETKTQVVNGSSKTKLDFGTFQITLSGVMKGNEFKTYIRQTPDDAPYRLEIDSQSNGNMGHLYLADESDDSVHVHVCPVTFSNNEDGYADFVYCVECDGEYIQQGDNSEGEVTFTDSYGREKQVLAKWTDNSLYGMIGLSEILN